MRLLGFSIVVRERVCVSVGQFFSIGQFFRVGRFVGVGWWWPSSAAFRWRLRLLALHFPSAGAAGLRPGPK
jgi:hypothetical protein